MGGWLRSAEKECREGKRKERGRKEEGRRREEGRTHGTNSRKVEGPCSTRSPVRLLPIKYALTRELVDLDNKKDRLSGGAAGYKSTIIMYFFIQEVTDVIDTQRGIDP